MQKAYNAVAAAASTGVANPLNRATNATTGRSNSHFAPQKADRVFPQSNLGRAAPSLGAWRISHHAVITTRRIPGPSPPRNIWCMLTLLTLTFARCRLATALLAMIE